MNYYERHLGDYAKDTAHLTMLEHGAYGLLLDRYYSTEQGIPADQAHRLARARSKEEKAAVDAVLGEFFMLSGDIWTNRRCDEEITKAQSKIKAAKENGKRGGRPKKEAEQTEEKPTGLSVGSETGTQTKALQSPDTRHQEKTLPSVVAESPPEAAEPASRKAAMSPDEIIFGYGVPLLTAAGTADKAARSFLGKLRKLHGDETVVNTLRQCIKAKPLQPLEWLAKAMPPPKATTPEADEQARRAETTRQAMALLGIQTGAKAPTETVEVIREC